MSIPQIESPERAWARVGILFACEPANESPDLERLLLATARWAPENSRLIPAAVTWLATCGDFVARHRLASLARAELEPEARAVLELILEEAVRHGASPKLRIGRGGRGAEPAFDPPAPLPKVQRGHAALALLAEQNSSYIARRLGLWFPPVELRPEILRPPRWILARNPTYYDRIVRKGDLRASILETLARDVRDRRAWSESHLAGLVGATLPAVRAALADLTLEGRVERGAAPSNGRDHPVRLLEGARPALLFAPRGRAPTGNSAPG